MDCEGLSAVVVLNHMLRTETTYTQVHPGLGSLQLASDRDLSRDIQEVTDRQTLTDLNK